MNTYAATASTAYSSGKTVAKAVALFAVGILLVVMGTTLATAIPAIAEGMIGMTSIVLSRGGGCHHLRLFSIRGNEPIDILSTSLLMHMKG